MNDNLGCVDAWMLDLRPPSSIRIPPNDNSQNGLSEENGQGETRTLTTKGRYILSVVRLPIPPLALGDNLTIIMRFRLIDQVLILHGAGPAIDLSGPQDGDGMG
jgi:hypothetical protein